MQIYNINYNQRLFRQEFITNNENQEIVDSIDIDTLKRVHALFDRNSNINCSMLAELFGDALTPKQVRGLLSKIEQFGLILRGGDGKNTQYSQTGKFKRLFMRAEYRIWA